MTGRIYIHRGDEASFKAVKTSPARVRPVSAPKVIRLPKRPSTGKVCPLAENRTRRKIRYGQPFEIRPSKAERAPLEEHTLVDSEHMDCLRSFDSGKTWTGTPNLGIYVIHVHFIRG